MRMEILTQLRAMAAGEGKDWRRHRLLAMYCRACRELAAEVMRTQHGLVIVHHKHRSVALEEGSIQSLSLETNGLRDRATSVTLLRRPFQSNIEVFCRCSRVSLRGSDFLDPIARGERKAMLTPPGGDSKSR